MPRKKPIRYYDTTSLLNRLNPVVKLVWLLILSSLILWTKDFRVEIGLLIFILLLFKSTYIKPTALQGSKFLISTAILIGIIQLIFNHEGITLLEVFGLSIARSGILRALFISSRFLSFILLGYLFVITTEPNAFVYALMRIGVPYRFGFSLITALRLIPIFTKEVQNVYYAQITRGVRYRLNPPKRFFINVFQFLKVLLISAIKKVDALVLSMEGRSFGVLPERTYNRIAVYSFTDTVLFLLALTLPVLYIILERNSIL